MNVTHHELVSFLTGPFFLDKVYFLVNTQTIKYLCTTSSCSYLTLNKKGVFGKSCPSKSKISIQSLFWINLSLRTTQKLQRSVVDVVTERYVATQLSDSETHKNVAMEFIYD